MATDRPTLNTLSVLPILATPLGIVELPGAERLNGALRALLVARAAADPAPQNPLGYRSRDDLLEWTGEPVPALVAELFQGVHSFVRAVSDMSEAQWDDLNLEARGWYTITRPDGKIATQNYPLTAWTAVYCVAAPDASTSRFDSGVLRIHESRLGTMFPDATNSTLRLPFTPGHYTWRPVPGRMVVFPGSLNHEVALIRAPGELVLVALRVRFVSNQQTGMGRW
jgi:hypothetical protein